MLEQVAMPSSRGSSWPKEWTRVSTLQAASLWSEPPGKAPASLNWRLILILSSKDALTRLKPGAANPIPSQAGTSAPQSLSPLSRDSHHSLCVPPRIFTALLCASPLPGSVHGQRKQVSGDQSTASKDLSGCNFLTASSFLLSEVCVMLIIIYLSQNTDVRREFPA